MASATGIPQEHPRTIEAEAEQPLLGGPGAATQREEDAMPYNVFTGKLIIPLTLIRQVVYADWLL